MPKMTDDLKRYLLNMLFNYAPPPPTLWMGLTIEAPSEDATLETVSVLEPDVSGYRRQPLAAKDWVLTENPIAAATDGVNFRNGSDDSWPGVAGAFLASSQDGKGVLITWVPLRHARVLMTGDTLQVPMRLEW